jgi:hypothetical protein
MDTPKQPAFGHLRWRDIERWSRFGYAGCVSNMRHDFLGLGLHVSGSNTATPVGSKSLT